MKGINLLLKHCNTKYMSIVPDMQVSPTKSNTYLGLILQFIAVSIFVVAFDRLLTVACI